MNLPPPQGNGSPSKRQQIGQSFKIGQVVFFKQAKATAAPSPMVGQFKGHGFGVYLGAVPPGFPNPPGMYIVQALGMVGYIKFDDVIEFLGKEAADLCIEKFKVKYEPKPPVQEGKEIRCNRDTGHWGTPLCDCGLIRTGEDGKVSLEGVKKDTGIVDREGKPILSNEGTTGYIPNPDGNDNPQGL